MPQMAPLSWITLMIFFTLVFLMFNIMNFYLNQNKIDKTGKKIMMIKKMNWKW